jgi:hypothetical protein
MGQAVDGWLSVASSRVSSGGRSLKILPQTERSGLQILDAGPPLDNVPDLFIYA